MASLTRIMLAVVLATTALAHCLFADPPPRSPYRPVGAPANPKVEVRWNRFYDYEQATRLLKALAAAYPKLAKLESLGKSYGKREMWVLTITDPATGKAEEKPAFWIDGGIHANEVQSVEVVLYTAWYLLESSPDNRQVQRLLRERAFYLCPMMSPDSRDAHFYKPNTTHSPRTGQRPFDDDRDGLVDEDGPDDLDGDGHITMMRVRDPNGKYKPHPKYPNLMIRVEGREQGQYRLLGSEGIDNDNDGQVNEDGDGFYDPNRDWPWNWQPSYVQRGARKYPLSVPENRMVANFVMSRPNIAGAQSYHNTGGMILRGPGAKSDKYDPRDVAVLDELAKTGLEMLPGYRYLNVANELYEVYGGEFDWFYGMRGAYAFTNELFTGYNFFRNEEEKGFGTSETRHKFDKLLLLSQGTSPWKKAQHPQYGEIEIGGLKKNWMRQPPSFLLEEECHRNMAFTLFHADEMPLVKIQSVKVEPAAGGLTQVTATIANDRICPSRAAVDIKNKITRPDLVKIEGQGLRVIAGWTSSEPFFRRPSEQRRRPAELRLDSVPGRGAVYARWLVKGGGPYRVSVDSVKGGRDSKTAD